MATLTTDGLDEFGMSMEELALLPDSVLQQMLTAEANIIKAGQAQTASTMLRGPYYAGGVVGGLSVGKYKRDTDGASTSVVFKGKQHGNRVAEIAYVNEYGARGVPPRSFIRTANEMYAETAVESAADVYDNHLKSMNL